MIDYVSNADTLKSEKEDIFLFFFTGQNSSKGQTTKGSQGHYSQGQVRGEGRCQGEG